MVGNNQGARMTWMLFVIVMEATRYFVLPQGPFISEAVCLEAREGILSTGSQPKVNYDAICIPTDQLDQGGI